MSTTDISLVHLIAFTKLFKTVRSISVKSIELENSFFASSWFSSEALSALIEWSVGQLKVNLDWFNKALILFQTWLFRLSDSKTSFQFMLNNHFILSSWCFRNQIKFRLHFSLLGIRLCWFNKVKWYLSCNTLFPTTRWRKVSKIWPEAFLIKPVLFLIFSSSAHARTVQV